MALDDLLERLTRCDSGTSGTSRVLADVPANPLQTLGGTSGTSGTSGKCKGGGEVSEPLPTDTAPPIRALRWLIHFLDRDPLEVIFAPAASHAEVLAAEPDAVAAEPLPEVRTPVRSAVRTETRVPGCKSCRHMARPGLSAGYCSGRDDLPTAYGLRHPLRKLPDDEGADCASYLPWEG